MIYRSIPSTEESARDGLRNMHCQEAKKEEGLQQMAFKEVAQQSLSARQGLRPTHCQENIVTASLIGYPKVVHKKPGRRRDVKN